MAFRVYPFQVLFQLLYSFQSLFQLLSQVGLLVLNILEFLLQLIEILCDGSNFIQQSLLEIFGPVELQDLVVERLQAFIECCREPGGIILVRRSVQ